ncbi:hypothetical protein [Polaromonas sp.]|uniref:hypothetical protein n=1 Tax=Polaromonas sp. TaxID=1869339 RepID=UPI0025F03831|nr:hypothetical protein [Polaromonas sp.]
MEHYDAIVVSTGQAGLSLAVQPANSGKKPTSRFRKGDFSCLDLYTDEVLDAWYGLFKTGDGKYFQQLMKAV